MAVAQAAHAHALSPNDHIMWALELGLDPSPGYRSQQHGHQPTAKGPGHPLVLSKKLCLQEFDSDKLPYFISPLKDI